MLYKQKEKFVIKHMTGHDKQTAIGVTCSSYVFSPAAPEPEFSSLFSILAGCSTAEWQSGEKMVRSAYLLNQ